MIDLVKQQVVDEEHLRLLRIGYFVSAGVTAFFGLFGLFYAAMGCLFAFAPKPVGPPSPNQMPAGFGWLFVAFGLGFTIVGLGLAALKLRVARCLRERRGRAFCMIIAAICCVGIPYGTVLGVFTFLVLGRPSVSELFQAAPPVHEASGISAGGA